MEKRKIIVTEEEYKKLKELMSIIKDEKALPGERRLAMAQYDRILLRIIRKENNR
ncbi:hypothetical protein ABEV41_00500 [Geobacillus thermodenitrificans]|jgi:hypothetical protein|uniref:hypothetical protein n=1 Tax=Geobacillus thermodenitrificans TaxID=33940 RepID=UPI003D19B435